MDKKQAMDQFQGSLASVTQTVPQARDKSV